MSKLFFARFSTYTEGVNAAIEGLQNGDFTLARQVRAELGELAAKRPRAAAKLARLDKAMTQAVKGSKPRTTAEARAEAKARKTTAPKEPVHAEEPAKKAAFHEPNVTKLAKPAQDAPAWAKACWGGLVKYHKQAGNI